MQLEYWRQQWNAASGSCVWGLVDESHLRTQRDRGQTTNYNTNNTHNYDKQNYIIVRIYFLAILAPDSSHP